MCKHISCHLSPIDWNYLIELTKLKNMTLKDETGALESDNSLTMASWELPPSPEGCRCHGGGGYSC